jgi:hypothetical protein
MKMNDLVARSFTFAYLNRRRGGYRPSDHKRIVKALHGGKLRFAAGYYDFVWDTLEIIRLGAVSVHLSSIEAGELYGVSSRTFERWVAAAEEAGVVRVLNTQAKNNRVRRNRHRRQGKNCYFAGPALAKAYGAAIYEGCDKEVIGTKLAGAARAQGAKLRKLCREDARGRKNLAWIEKFQPAAPSSLRSDSLSDPPSPDGSEIGASRSEFKERPGAAFEPAAPVDLDAKLHVTNRSAASLETNANTSGQAKTAPKSTTSHLASNEVVDAKAAKAPTMLELALARMEGEAKRLRGGFNLLVFFLLVATTACGTVFDDEKRTNREFGNRARAGTHGTTPFAGKEGRSDDASPAERRKDRRRAGGRKVRHSGHNFKNAHTRGPTVGDRPIFRPDGKWMETTDINTKQGTIDNTEPDNVILEAESDAEDMIFAWDTEKPMVVIVRRVHGLSTRKPDAEGRVSPPMPQNAEIVAYARLDNPKAREILTENLGTSHIPMRLEPGTHMIRVLSSGASGLRVSILGTEVESPDPDENERESRATNANPDNGAETEPEVGHAADENSG